MAKLGIPHILWYYQDYPRWDIFFRSLGLEVIISNPTRRQTLDSGLRFAEAELCLPVKIAFGHVLDLREKVDYLFIPHLVSRYKDFYSCPNFTGLPDMIKNSIDSLPRLISPVIDANKKTLNRALFYIGCKFTKNPLKIINAVNKSVNFSKKEIKNIPPADTGKLKIALIGHPYIIGDEFINMDIIKKLNALGAGVYSPDMLPQKAISRKLKQIKSLNWEFIKRLHAGLVILLEGGADGVINITSFGCGPDSFSSEIFRSEAKAFKTPYLWLNIDEHASELGFNTRIEAFMDMIKRKKRRAR